MADFNEAKLACVPVILALDRVAGDVADFGDIGKRNEQHRCRDPESFGIHRHAVDLRCGGQGMTWRYRELRRIQLAEGAGSGQVACSPADARDVAGLSDAALQAVSKSCP